MTDVERGKEERKERSLLMKATAMIQFAVQEETEWPRMWTVALIVRQTVRTSLAGKEGDEIWRLQASGKKTWQGRQLRISILNARNDEGNISSVSFGWFFKKSFVVCSWSRNRRKGTLFILPCSLKSRRKGISNILTSLKLCAFSSWSNGILT